MKQVKKFTLITYAFYVAALILIAYTVLDKYLLEDDQQNQVETVTIPKPNEFGFISDHLIKDDLSVNTNETFSDILLNYNVGYPTIDFIVKNYKDVFDFRKIVTGNRYHVYVTQDSIPKLDYLVYEKNPIDFVVVNLKDSGQVYAGSKKVEIKTRTNYGRY